MKTIIRLAWTVCLMTVLAVSGSMFLKQKLVKVLLIAVLITVWGILLYRLYDQKKIVEFLVKQQKKGAQKVQWNPDESKELDLIRKRVDLYTLQSQINPHFLYNTLDSIRGKALLDGQREIADMTEILSRFFRYCISSSENLVKLQEEVDHVKDYYYIQKYRFEDRFDMTIDVENERILDYYIPKTTIQPIVENAMVHGLEKVNRKGLLQLQIIETQETVQITVSDNGIGMSVEELDQINERMKQNRIAGGSKAKHSGIATSNVNARIKVTFGEQYGISYRSMAGEGTDAVIVIPKIDDFSRVKYEEQLGY